MSSKVEDIIQKLHVLGYVQFSASNLKKTETE